MSWNILTRPPCNFLFCEIPSPLTVLSWNLSLLLKPRLSCITRKRGGCFSLPLLCLCAWRWEGLFSLLLCNFPWFSFLQPYKSFAWSDVIKLLSCLVPSHLFVTFPIFSHSSWLLKRFWLLIQCYCQYHYIGHHSWRFQNQCRWCFQHPSFPLLVFSASLILSSIILSHTLPCHILNLVVNNNCRPPVIPLKDIPFSSHPVLSFQVNTSGSPKGRSSYFSFLSA